MSGPAQTPASKRFLASQSTSSSASARRSQFMRTPQQSRSSPFNATPPVRRQIVTNDEIETSFEDESNDFSSTSKSQRFERLNNDNIIDDFQEDSENKFTPLPSERRNELVNSSRDQPQATAMEDIDQSWSPLPKRQKLDHSHKTTKAERTIISSSAPSEHSDAEDLVITANSIKPYLEGDGTDTIEEPVSAASRFLIPTPSKPHAIQDYIKPSYKAFRQHTTAEDGLKVNVALPDTFSPSRRRGKREYLHGGAADTVRNTILHIADEQMEHEQQQTTLKSMRHIMTDESGRFDIAKDKDGGTWMLVHQADQLGKRSLSKVVDVAGCANIMLKGSATSWTVMLPHGKQIAVAVLWDAVQPTNQPD